MSTKELIKQEQDSKFKEEIKYINYRLLTSMSYLDLADDERTLELYSKLDHALVEVLKIQKELGI